MCVSRTSTYPEKRERERTGEVVKDANKLLDTVQIRTGRYTNRADYRILNHGTVEHRSLNGGSFAGEWRTIGLLEAVEPAEF